MIRIFLAAVLALSFSVAPASAEGATTSAPEPCVPESRVVTIDNPEIPFSFGHTGWIVVQYSLDGVFYNHNQKVLTITEPVDQLVILKEKTCTSPTPTPLPTPTPEPSPSPTPTPEPTSTPTPTPEPTPSSTPSPTPEPTTTPTTQPSPSASATPEATPTPALERLPDTGSNLVLGWLALLVIATGGVIVHAAREIEKRAR